MPARSRVKIQRQALNLGDPRFTRGSQSKRPVLFKAATGQADTQMMIQSLPVAFSLMHSLYSKETNAIGEDATVLNGTSVLKGNISAVGKLEIRGMVAGKIKMENGDLIIRESASVEGDIEAENIFIEGAVSGNIKADSRLALASSSMVRGDLTTPILEIKSGALYRGNVSMAGKSE